ncbi:MAG: hypoxanthine phosphoribosyltransferase [Clostridia bacterium]
MNVLINESRIEKRLTEMAKQIDKDYQGKEVVLLGILKGSIVFMVELAKKLKTKVEFEFMEVASYEGLETTGKVKIIKDLRNSIEGKNVIIVEDIIDTGITLSFLTEYLKLKNPKSLKIATLLSKPSRRTKELNVDYIGFSIEDKFVIGYGLDYNQFYRNLPYIGYIENEQDF